MIKLTLHTLPLSVNATYKRGKNSFYKSREAKETQEAMAWEARSQYRGKPLECKILVDVAFFWKNMRKDIDGPLKSVLDAMQGIVYVNDNQIVDLHVLKGKDSINPRMEMLVSEV